MSRHKTKSPPEIASVQALMLENRGSDKDQVHRFACTLVTPMYGGGVEKGTVDLAMPIRATAIRGQLRHWWRLLNRKNEHGKLRSPQELFKIERDIWGGLGDADTLAASKVSVSVKARPAREAELQPVAAFETRGDRLKGPFFKNVPAYALFPAQGKMERGQVTEQPKELLRAGFKFELVLNFDKNLDDATRKQVLDSVRWWGSFGGVGARTRRGCGAVEIVDANRRPQHVRPAEVEAEGWQLVLHAPAKDATTAWTKAIDALQSFRQGPNQGRNPGQGNHPGRSRWPEPDAIRRITEKNDPKHKPEHKAGNVFPRAAFGLPIIFHFKDDRTKDDRTGDPMETTLKPCPEGSNAAAERMASPLIVRPYMSGNGWCPAVLCMDLDHINRMGLSLEGKFGRSPYEVKADQWQASAAAIHIKPMDGHADAIAAFLSYFEKSGPAFVAAPAAHATATTERPKFAVKMTGLRLTLNRNGSLEARNTKTQKCWYAHGDKALELLGTLPAPKQDELRSGRYIWADIEAAEHDIISVRIKA